MHLLIAWKFCKKHEKNYQSNWEISLETWFQQLIQISLNCDKTSYISDLSNLYYIFVKNLSKATQIVDLSFFRNIKQYIIMKIFICCDKAIWSLCENKDKIFFLLIGFLSMVNGVFLISNLIKILVISNKFWTDENVTKCYFCIF